MSKRTLVLFTGAALLTGASCQSKHAEPEPKRAAEPLAARPTPVPASAEHSEPLPSPSAPQPSTRAPAEPSARTPGPVPSSKPVRAVVVAKGGSDPLHGKFTLAQATAGLPGKGRLAAVIETSKGQLECALYDDKAPIAVANFVGLARGLRPFKDPSGNWIKKPAYDGTLFHRVIPGFVIQGGDPRGDGTGEPGYAIPDEIWPGSFHDRRGLLCMANRNNKDTSGMQFFIMDGMLPQLDGTTTIFGECKPDALIETLANVPTNGERPIEPLQIVKISVVRRTNQ